MAHDLRVLSVPRSWSSLTPGWMTAALAERFPGVVVSEVRLDDLADGTNRRARVQLRYQSGSGPESVFVKREGRVLNRLALLALGALESEARLFDARAQLPLEHPTPYAAAVDRRRLATVVVMEDVTLRLARPNLATVALTVGQVRSGLRGLARLHAAYWDQPLPEPMRFLGPWRLGITWAPLSLASLARGLHLLRAGGQAIPLPPAANAATLERGFRRWAKLAASGSQTVLHGDPHPGNTYALPGEETGFYDWQLVRTGNWSHDVGYFIVSSLDVADRGAHERSLLRYYLDELTRHGAPAPDFEDAWHLYRLTPAFGLGTWLHTLSGGGFQPVEQCVATIERFAAAYADYEMGV
jgi:aminoglycoside phosphotransferase (APT) family kinase protein